LRRGDWSMLPRTAISLFRGVKSIISSALNYDYSRGVLTFLLPGLVAGLRGKGMSKMSLSSKKASSGPKS